VSDIFAEIDRLLISGLSAPKIADLLGIRERTIRRRKACLRDEGFTFNAQGNNEPREQHAINNSF
jgi:biotin operon repressor